MPIYEYVCQSCGGELEQLQRLSDTPLTECPACAQPALVKRISAAGFRLKGGGWYETDFKNANKRNLAGDRPDKPPEKSGKDTKPAESTSKPAAGKTDGGKAAAAAKPTDTAAAA